MIPLVGRITEDLWTVFGYPDLTLEQLDLYLEHFKPRCMERPDKLLMNYHGRIETIHNHELTDEEQRYKVLLQLRDLKRQGWEPPRPKLREVQQAIRDVFDGLGLEKDSRGCWKKKGEPDELEPQRLGLEDAV
jgi:hypothetical protein